MAFIQLADWDKKQLRVDAETTRPPKGSNSKPRTRIRVSYGEDRRAPALVTPFMVCDWPMLGAEGNLNSTFGPSDEDKAQWQVSLTDRRIARAPPGSELNDAESGQNLAAGRLMQALCDIDDAVAEYVYSRRAELLGAPKLSKEQVRAKMNPLVRAKCDESGNELYKRCTVSLKKYAWDGTPNELVVVKRGEPYAGEIKHEDVLQVALQVDCVYTMPTGSFGVKLGIVEISHVSSAAPAQHADKKARVSPEGWAAAPTWADDGEE